MQHVAVSNGTIAVIAQGKGPAILFVHGFPLTHAMWNAQVAALSGKYRVIAPDLLGFGESQASHATVSMESYADDLHGLLHGVVVDKPVIFCGLSMGGYVAWQFFRKYRAQLRALILCDTRAVADTSEAAQGRHKLAETVRNNGMNPALEAMLPRLFAPETVTRRPEVVSDVRGMILHNKPLGVAAALEALAERPDCTDLLPTIDVPTLLICGKEDQIAPPAEMQGIAEAIPGAEFVEIPAAGHMAPMENSEAVNAAISRFLASLRS